MPALVEDHRVPVRAVRVGVHAEAEKTRHPVALQPAEQAGKPVDIIDDVQLPQLLPGRLAAPGLDLGLVHEAGVEVTDQLIRRTRFTRSRRRLLDDFPTRSLGLVPHLVERAVDGLICRYRILRQPLPVDVREQVVLHAGKRVGNCAAHQ